MEIIILISPVIILISCIIHSIYWDAIYESEIKILNTYLNEKCKSTANCTSFKEVVEVTRWIDYSKDLFLISRRQKG